MHKPTVTCKKRRSSDHERCGSDAVASAVDCEVPRFFTHAPDLQGGAPWKFTHGG